jgi:hypothetical protein
MVLATRDISELGGWILPVTVEHRDPRSARESKTAAQRLGLPTILRETFDANNIGPAVGDDSKFGGGRVTAAVVNANHLDGHA